MGGFSSNYEGGYLDFEETPKWMNQEKKSEIKEKAKIYKEKSSAENRYLNVLLSDENLLNPEGKTCREDLCQYCESDIYLMLQQEGQEIRVYYQNNYIGNIQKSFEKIDNTEVLNDFCFVENRLKDIEAFWDGKTFYLKEKKSRLI
jgi:hypothetical protein